MRTQMENRDRVSSREIVALNTERPGGDTRDAVDIHPLRGLLSCGPNSRNKLAALSDPIRIAIVAPQGEVRRVVELLRELQQFHRPKEHKQYLLDIPGFSKVFGMRLTRTPGPTTIELPLHCKHKVQPKSGRVLRRHAAAKSRRSVAYYCSAATAIMMTIRMVA
jgi:hypothetical protein